MFHKVRFQSNKLNRINFISSFHLIDAIYLCHKFHSINFMILWHWHIFNSCTHFVHLKLLFFDTLDLSSLCVHRESSLIVRHFETRNAWRIFTRVSIRMLKYFQSSSVTNTIFQSEKFSFFILTWFIADFHPTFRRKRWKYCVHQKVFTRKTGRKSAIIFSIAWNFVPKKCSLNFK